MENENPIISILSGQGFKISEYPEDGAEEIDSPGFYYNHVALCIEHWSLPCPWNLPFAHHDMNGKGIVRDGFQSVVDLDDADKMILKMKEWLAYLKSHDVE